MGEVKVWARTTIEVVETNGALYQRTLSVGDKGGQKRDGSPKMTETYNSVFLGYVAASGE